MPLDFRDVFFLAPEIVLTVWGLAGAAGGSGSGSQAEPGGSATDGSAGWRWLGWGSRWLPPVVVCFVPLFVRAYPHG